MLRRNSMKKWFEIKNKADKAEIWIYEQIGEDFWTGEGTTAKSFQKELSVVKASQIDLHINSPGGEIFEGVAIYNLLKQHPAKITTYIDGWAASIASVIALSGDRVIMAENGFFMIHEPFANNYSATAGSMRARADILDKISAQMIGVYKSKSKLSENEILALMKGPVDNGDNIGTWLTASEAINAGFVDEVAEKMDMAACAKFVPIMAKAGFKHIPENLSGDKKPLTARDLERILRDGGCSEAMAKGILTEGYKGEQRDVAPLSEQRDVAAPVPKRDRVADLLIKAEVMAPSL
jgi:ATP-dependent protease ClpP protease subunit